MRDINIQVNEGDKAGGKGPEQKSHRAQKAFCSHKDHQDWEPVKNFSTDKSNKKNHGYYQWCKACESKENFKKLHGLYETDYKNILAQQKGACEGCKDHITGVYLKIDPKPGVTLDHLFCDPCIERLKFKRDMITNPTISTDLDNYLKTHP